MTLVVGTAGHIDHGKTTLLRALTGIDADRLPEERRRGMTIDVGYAHLALPDGSEIDFVDVPGHDRLVGNMLVGAGEVDAVLLVVAADDGPRAQTLEHLELVDALGLGEGIVAITKADSVDRDRVLTVVEEVRQLLAPTRLSGAPIVSVSGVTGEGLGALRDELAALAGRVAPGATSGPRMAVDRVFSVHGRGVVVTGSLRGGPVSRGATLAVVPGGGQVRVREVQVHGRRVERSTAGRTALNLAGADARELRRGVVLAAPDVVDATDRLLVALRAPVALRRGERVAIPGDRTTARLHLGTDQVEVRLGRAGREAVTLPDGTVTALLRLERPVGAAPGDRFVLRRSSPSTTLAAGVVVDPVPPRGPSRRRADVDRVRGLVHAVVGGGDVPAARLVLHGALPGAAGGRPRDPGPRLSVDVAEALAERARELVEADHRTAPERGGMPIAELRAALVGELRRAVTIGLADATTLASGIVQAVLADGRIRRDGDIVRLPGQAAAPPSPEAVAAAHQLVAALDTPAPPPLAAAARAAGCAIDVVNALEREGRIVRIDDDLAWATPAWERLATQALDAAERAPLTPAALRDATGTSRKYVMALLEDLNRRGILARTAAGHVPGPRAGQLRPRPVA